MNLKENIQSTFCHYANTSKDYDTFLHLRTNHRMKHWKQLLGGTKWIQDTDEQIRSFYELCLHFPLLFTDQHSTTIIENKQLIITPPKDTRETDAFPGLLLHSDMEIAKSTLYAHFGDDLYEEKFKILKDIRDNPMDTTPRIVHTQVTRVIPPPTIHYVEVMGLLQNFARDYFHKLYDKH